MGKEGKYFLILLISVICAINIAYSQNPVGQCSCTSEGYTECYCSKDGAKITCGEKYCCNPFGLNTGACSVLLDINSECFYMGGNLDVRMYCQSCLSSADCLSSHAYCTGNNYCAASVSEDVCHCEGKDKVCSTQDGIVRETCAGTCEEGIDNTAWCATVDPSPTGPTCSCSGNALSCNDGSCFNLRTCSVGDSAGYCDELGHCIVDCACNAAGTDCAAPITPTCTPSDCLNICYLNSVVHRHCDNGQCVIYRTPDTCPTGQSCYNADVICRVPGAGEPGSPGNPLPEPIPAPTTLQSPTNLVASGVCPCADAATCPVWPITVTFSWDPVPNAEWYVVEVYSTYGTWMPGRQVPASECNPRCGDVWYGFPKSSAHWWRVYAGAGVSVSPRTDGPVLNTPCDEKCTCPIAPPSNATTNPCISQNLPIQYSQCVCKGKRADVVYSDGSGCKQGFYYGKISADDKNCGGCFYISNCPSEGDPA